MRWLLRFFFALVCLGRCLASNPLEDWLPVSPHDLEVKEVPGSPGASAIQLYYADLIDDNDHSEFFYRRIKVLSDDGKKYGNVELVVPFGRSFSDLKARTIRPDGSIVEFTGKPFEKILFKGRGVKLYAKTFTLPEVAAGGIVEYKYRLRNDEDVVFENQWIIEHDLFTVKEHFLFKYDGFLQAAYVTSGGLSSQPTNKQGAVELELENVPAFAKEEHMPPEDNYRRHVWFFFSPARFGTPDLFWQRVGQIRARFYEEFIGNRGEVRDAALAAIGGETDPEKKVRKLYARAQEIRNLTYERSRTEVEQKKEQLKPNENVGDVIRRGYGNRDEIAALFVGMARAAGFTSSMLLVSNRENRFFQKSVLSSGQLDSELVVVQVNGKPVFLDPGTRFCPFGLIRWMRSATAALQLDKNSVTFVDTPALAPGGAVTTRVASLTLLEDGLLKGNINVEFKAGDALERRLDAIRTDEAGRNKELEDEVKSWLPPNATAKLTGARGWESTDDPLVADFQIEVPAYASVAGKRLLAPAFLFQSKQKYMFRDATRKFPVYFPFAFAEVDRVTIFVPQGYSVESLPEKIDATSTFARYQNLCRSAGQRIVNERVLVMNGSFFQPDHYGELKDFFGKVQAGDDAQEVLRRAASADTRN
jgi:Domain of Unknown Function with PDB structure (DUF3857)/Transglutaminase-like superfamily